MKKIILFTLTFFIFLGAFFFFVEKNSYLLERPTVEKNRLMASSSSIAIISQSKEEASSTSEKNMIKEKVSLITDDGVKIIGLYTKVIGSKTAVLLLHMMPATKESWGDFSKLLNKDGFSTLAIDLRGHGESTEQEIGGEKKTLDYRYFSSPEHQESILDVKAASEFLEKEKFSLANQYLVGASIGSNLAFEFASQHPEIRKLVLLSPGLDYHGLKAEDYLKKISKNQKILAVASESDYYSFNSVESIAKMANKLGVDLKTIIYKDAGHGTNMFGKESPDLATSILNFLDK